MTYRIQSYTDVAAFIAAADPFLLADAAANNLQLGIVRRLPAQDHGHYLATVVGPAGVVGVITRTPGMRALLSDMPLAAIPAVVAAAADIGLDLPGVNSQRPVAEAFAQAWTAAYGGRARTGMGLGMYALYRVIAPRPGPGRLVAADSGDLDLLDAWVNAFKDELEDTFRRPAAEQRARNAQLIDQGNAFFWRLDDGAPAAMAHIVRDYPRGAAVSLVYTPPALRGRGYASRCVAAVSQIVLDRGKEHASLHTDLANPTSNKIYQAIGYEKIGEAVEIDFITADSS